jgi:hypothetical protein
MFATLMQVTDTRREQWNADVISSARQIFASFLKFRKQYKREEEFDPNVLFDQLDLKSRELNDTTDLNN